MTSADPRPGDVVLYDGGAALGVLAVQGDRVELTSGRCCAWTSRATWARLVEAGRLAPARREDVGR